MPRSLRRLPLLAALFVAFLAVPARADDGAAQLAAKIDAVINGPDYKHSRWGLLVVDNDSGRTVYEHNPDMLFAPASVTKLYTCAAALSALGPDYRFETPVYRRGDVTGGRLHGDLILVAQGDLSFGGRGDASGKLLFKNHDHIYADWLSTRTELTNSDPLAGLNDLARQVKEGGIKQVEGDVLIDDRLFARSRGSGSGPDVVTPILVNDNLVDVRVTPADKAGEPATVELRPQTAYAQIDVQVDTVGEGKPARLESERVGPERFVVRGEVPVNGKPLVRICPVDEPAAFARALFIEALRRQGVSVRAGVHQAPTAELPEKGSTKDLTRVALLKSPPFSEAVKVTLKVSHNLYASTMPLLGGGEVRQADAGGGAARGAAFFGRPRRGRGRAVAGERGGRRQRRPRDAADDGAAVAGHGQAAGMGRVQGRPAGAGRGRHPGGRGGRRQPGPRQGPRQDRHLRRQRPAQRPTAAAGQVAGRRHDHGRRPQPHRGDLRQRRAAAGRRRPRPRGQGHRPAMRDYLSE